MIATALNGSCCSLPVEPCRRSRLLEALSDAISSTALPYLRGSVQKGLVLARRDLPRHVVVGEHLVCPKASPNFPCGNIASVPRFPDTSTLTEKNRSRDDANTERNKHVAHHQRPQRGTAIPNKPSIGANYDRAARCEPREALRSNQNIRSESRAGSETAEANHASQECV